MTTRLLQPLREPADLDILVDMRVAWSTELGRLGDTGGLRHDIAKWLEREGESRLAWVAEEDGRAVGMVSLFVYSRMPDVGGRQGRWGYVAQLFVLPEHRRQGHAASLMAALQEHARAEGLARIVLHPSEMSIPFYRSLGYRPADELLLLPLA